MKSASVLLALVSALSMAGAQRLNTPIGNPVPMAADGFASTNGMTAGPVIRWDKFYDRHGSPLPSGPQDSVGPDSLYFKQVSVLDAGEQKPGLHRLSWDRDNEGRKLSAGAYFVLLDLGTEKARLKAVVR